MTGSGGQVQPENTPTPTPEVPEAPADDFDPLYAQFMADSYAAVNAANAESDATRAGIGAGPMPGMGFGGGGSDGGGGVRQDNTQVKPRTETLGRIPSQQDTDNWSNNFKVVMYLTMKWFTGLDKPIGLGERFTDDEVAGAMRNAEGVGKARDFFYSKYRGAKSLEGAKVTNYDVSFGLSGLVGAGLDPVEQFVGSYKVNISVVGNSLVFSIRNTTSFTSFLYGIGPSWTFGPMSNYEQTFKFTEPIQYWRLK